jgi:hypothetical protein
MTRRTTFTHKFVEYIPDVLEEGAVYVSIPYATVAHKCFCGCGNEVNTPLSPTDWRLTFDGETISLYPSIGSWSLPCESHYWMERNRVRWAPKWSRKEIDDGRKRDRFAKERYFDGTELPALGGSAEAEVVAKSESKPSIWRRLRHWW